MKGRFRTASVGQVQGSINEGQVQNSISGGRFRAASVRAGGRFRIAGQATAGDDRKSKQRRHVVLQHADRRHAHATKMSHSRRKMQTSQHTVHNNRHKISILHLAHS